MIRYETIITDATIIHQMNKFFINWCNFEFDFKKLGRTKIKTATKKIAGIIVSRFIN